MSVPAGPSYVRSGKIMRFTAADQPATPTSWPIWIRVEHVPLRFIWADGVVWARVYGRQLGSDGTPWERVELRVRLSALPRHLPTPGTATCPTCSPPGTALPWLPAAAWPCLPAHAALTAEHEGDMAGLRTYLDRVVREVCGAVAPAAGGDQVNRIAALVLAELDRLPAESVPPDRPTS